jgi:hypothetical protein
VWFLVAQEVRGQKSGQRGWQSGQLPPRDLRTSIVLRSGRNTSVCIIFFEIVPVWEDWLDGQLCRQVGRGGVLAHVAPLLGALGYDSGLENTREHNNETGGGEAGRGVLLGGTNGHAEKHKSAKKRRSKWRTTAKHETNQKPKPTEAGPLGAALVHLRRPPLTFPFVSHAG